MAMLAASDPARANGMIIRTQKSAKITFNGQEYEGVENMPLAVRKTYEMAIAAMDASRNAAAGSPINVHRAEHRREHLDEIERVLARR